MSQRISRVAVHWCIWQEVSASIRSYSYKQVLCHCTLPSRSKKNPKKKNQWIDSKREFKISQDKCVTVGLEQGYKSKQGCPPPSQIINSPQSHPSLTHHTLPDQQWCCHFSRGFAAYATSLGTYIYWILSKSYRLQWEIAAVKSESCTLLNVEDQKIQSGKLTVSGTEHPAGQSDPLTSLFPSGKVLFLKKKKKNWSPECLLSILAGMQMFFTF